MKLLKLVISLILLLASVFLCQQIITNSIANQSNKYDYAELNHIKYGLLSIDEWKRQITVILTEEINKLYLTQSTKKDLKKPVETLLNTLIDQVVLKIKQQNSGSTKGKIKQAFINSFVKVEDIKKGIPEYADALINELTKPKTKTQLKSVLNKQLDQYFSLTFDTQDKTPILRILLSTDSKDIASAEAKLEKIIAKQSELILKESALLILFAVILFSMFGFSNQPLSLSQHILAVLMLLTLLIVGVTTPMIDMEAKISQMTLVVMGNVISFDNQLLYFQSKSILDVFKIMINHQDIPMKFVGLLLITFSIIFPLLKLVSSLIYYSNFHQARQNRTVQFFALKSGKWSMADVMVVAIFMAYIGFNGIITNQIDKLSAAAGEGQGILTTNGTSLEPGYYLFFAFTLLGLFLSGFLTRVRAEQPAKQIQNKEIVSDVPERQPIREETQPVREVKKAKQNVDDSGKYNVLNVENKIDIKRISTGIEQHPTPRTTDVES